MGSPVTETRTQRWNLSCKWRGRLYNIPLTSNEIRQAHFADLKQILYEQLCVPVDRQKFLGVTLKGARGPIDDAVLLLDLTFSGGEERSFTLVGTPEEEQLPAEVAEAASALDSDYNSLEAQKMAARANASPIMLQQIAHVNKRLKINCIRQPRPNKKLLVLDIDYTIYDCKGASLGFPIDELKRPYLEVFLTALWPYYDYVIWSQTGWQWIEMKCTELGLLTDPSMGPCFTLDKYAMLSWNLTDKPNTDKKARHNVKSLQIIWQKFPEHFGPHNTLHVDDLSRNFRMNPSNGILVAPYLRYGPHTTAVTAACSENRHTDRELLKLGHYLVTCAQLEDIREWDHSKWRNSAVCQGT